MGEEYDQKREDILNDLSDMSETAGEMLQNSIKALDNQDGDLAWDVINKDDYLDSYQERGYEVLAMFDVDPAIIGLEFNNIKVLDLELADQFIRENDIEVAALAVPSDSAQTVADMVLKAGVKALWDFTETPLEVPEDAILIEQNMNDGLCKISCRLMEQFEQDSRLSGELSTDQ